MKQKIIKIVFAVLLIGFVVLHVMAFLWKKIELKDLIAFLWVFPLIGLALFQEDLKKILSSPELIIVFNLKEPICIKCPTKIRKADGTNEDSEGYYFRFKVRNIGRSRAKNCECCIEALKTKTNNEWITDDTFQPMKLQWSNRPGQEFIDIEANSYGSFCDLVNIDRYNIIKQNSPNLVINYGPGMAVPYSQQSRLEVNKKHKVDIVIYSENITPKKVSFEIEFSGNWQDQPKEMFKEISIKTI